MNGLVIWLIIAAVLAVVGGITLYFTFLKSSNNTKFKGFLSWLYDFLTFKKMLIETLLKIVYLISAIFITLGSFGFIGQSFLAFIGTLILGNLSIRLIYEFLLVQLVICRNTTEINTKMTQKENKEKEEVKEEVNQ